MTITWNVILNIKDILEQSLGRVSFLIDSGSIISIGGEVNAQKYLD